MGSPARRAFVVLLGFLLAAVFVAARPTMIDQTRPDARALLERAISAKGGLDRLRSIRTIVMRGVMTVTGSTPVDVTDYIEYPNRFRQDARLAGGAVTQVCADGVTWMKDPSGVHDVPAEAAVHLRAAVSRDIVSLLVQAADGKLALQVVPRAAGTDDRFDTLRVSGSVSPVDLLIDRRTGVVAGKRYIVEQPGAVGKVPTEETYSDYRAVDGLQVAFKTLVRRGAAVILEQTLSDLKVNVPLDPALFER
jgi:hypothetical protein